MTDSFRSLQQLAAAIPDGARIAVAQDSCGVSMALTRALIRRKARGLHLVCVPISGMQADLLIGSGCVDTIETSAVSLGEYGSAPRFLAALRSGRLRLLEATCPAIHAALQAGEKDLPFIPLRGLIGSDVLQQQQADGPSRKLVGFEMIDRGIARQGYTIYAGGETVGAVTSGTQTPFLKKAIGLGYVAAAHAAHGTPLEIDIRGRRLKAVVVPTPFYKRTK